MDEYRYRWECLRRNPEFQRDSAEYQREVWDAISGDLDVAKDAAGIPAWARRQSEAIRRFETKYPLASFHHVFAVGKASPFLFDPAWMVAKGQTATSDMTEHGGRHAPSPDDLGADARNNYDAMPEQIKTLWRHTYAATIFAATRIFLPITAATRLEHIRKLWSEVQRQQVRCYGPEALASAKRKHLPSTRYELRLRVWDAVEAGRPMREVARTHRLSIWTAYRYYYQAAGDIDPKGFEGLRTPEGMQAHVRSCAACRAAEAAGTSDKYCRWMQRHLPSSRRYAAERLKSFAVRSISTSLDLCWIFTPRRLRWPGSVRWRRGGLPLIALRSLRDDPH